MNSLRHPIPYCPPAKPPVTAPFPELIRPRPRPYRSFEDWNVFVHRDLLDMTPDQLAAESAAVEARIAVEAPRVDGWFFERLARVRSLVAQIGATR